MTMLSFGHKGFGLSSTDNPVTWLNRNDHDRELHETVHRLLHPAGQALARTAEAVLLLEAYIAATAQVRATLPEWNTPEWRAAVEQLSDLRTYVAIKRVQHLLRATMRAPKP